MSASAEECLTGEESLSPCTETAIKRKRKFTGGNASKRHRDRVNIEFNNLAKLLPFPDSVIAKLDKSSILRLAVSYIRAKSFFKDTLHSENELEVLNNDSKDGPHPSEQRIREGTGLVSGIFANALDGFLLVLTEDMKVLFVSDSVRDYLGYCQAGIIHENFLQFVNPTDHSIVQANMMYRKSEIDRREESIDMTDFNNRHSFSNSQIALGIGMQGRKQSIVRREFVCRMKCAFSCSSRFYTAYRTFHFSGHLRRSTIQEGREEKHLNTLVIFASPSTSGSNQSIDIVPDLDEKLSHTLSTVSIPVEKTDYMPFERYSNGFRIEPTLRPHIAPIPVSSGSENPDERFQTKARHVPMLIPASEVYSKDPPYLISKSLPSYLPQMYVAPGLNESSRYSDHSDDSKCSPASSPNLVWKRRPTSPLITSNYKVDHYKSNGRTNYFQRDKDFFRRTDNMPAEYYPSKRISSPDGTPSRLRSPANVDVYLGATMLMNLKRQGSESPKQFPFSDIPEVPGTKRRMDDDERSSYSPKRLKSPNSHRGNFLISSLLDLDVNGCDKKENGRDKNTDACQVNKEHKQRPYDDIFHKMSKNLDYTFYRAMSVNKWYHL